MGKTVEWLSGVGLASLLVAGMAVAQGDQEKPQGPSPIVRIADASSENTPKGQWYDKATIGGDVELSVGNESRINFAKGACSFLVRKEVAGWNELSPCRVVSILNRPTHGTLMGGGEGIYIYAPKTLGKDVIRFIVENTEGKKAIVTLRISVVTP